MILSRMVLRNFRQFRQADIAFAAPDADVGKNVTVILGENGRGKTGIYRALMFCLYGDYTLTQDEDVKKEEIYLVNKAAVREASEDHKPVYASVRVEFTHRGRRHSIERGVKAFLDGDRQLEQRDRVELSYEDASGNTKVVDIPVEISRIVAGILDKRVREYFLFDGEKIDHLTRASAAQRTEVGKGIRCLLDIDDLEKSIRALERLRKDLGDELAKASTGEYAQVLTELNSVDSAIEKRKGRLEEIDGELVRAEAQKRSFDAQLRQYEEIASLVEERKKLEASKETREKESTEMLAQMKDRVGPSAVLLAGDLIQRIYSKIDDKRQRGEIPSALRKDLIERILENRECICKGDVLPGSPAFDAIMEWKNKAVDESIESTAMDLWRLLSGMLGKFDVERVLLETNIQRYADTRNEIETLSQDVEHISEQLGDSDREDLSNLEQLRKSAGDAIIGLKAEALAIAGELQELNQSHVRLSARRDELQRKETLKTDLTRRADLAVQTHQALQNIKSEFTEKVKASLSDDASSMFQRLLDEEGRRMLRRIVVENDYSLQVLDPWGKEFLANISAGQRQVASIAFILALAKAAAGGDVLEMPLFMDTPFGKLSWQHRENLIRAIPSSAAQWILLATDTELGRREADLLLRGGAWGRFDVLEPESDGSTTVHEFEVDQALVVLKAAEAAS